MASAARAKELILALNQTLSEADLEKIKLELLAIWETAIFSAEIVDAPHTRLSRRESEVMSMILIAAGMFFKVAAVPFHMWAPDAYEGAPTSITAFMSVGVKAASFAMFGRLFLYGLPDLRGSMAGDPASHIPALPGWALLLGVVLLRVAERRPLAGQQTFHPGHVVLGGRQLQRDGLE